VTTVGQVPRSDGAPDEQHDACEPTQRWDVPRLQPARHLAVGVLPYRIEAAQPPEAVEIDDPRTPLAEAADREVG